MQQSFADTGYANRKRKTKRDAFLGIMEAVIPWDEWCAIVEPYYPSGKRGLPPRGVKSMLRMYLLANWFDLSDEGVEDAVYDSYAFMLCACTNLYMLGQSGWRGAYSW